MISARIVFLKEKRINLVPLYVALEGLEKGKKSQTCNRAEPTPQKFLMITVLIIQSFERTIIIRSFESTIIVYEFG